MRHRERIAYVSRQFIDLTHLGIWLLVTSTPQSANWDMAVGNKHAAERKFITSKDVEAPADSTTSTAGGFRTCSEAPVALKKCAGWTD